MSQQPTILTQPELTQRTAKPVCLIQSEEVLRVSTPAYATSNSDLSFLVRQPSSSAILVNDVRLLVEVAFQLDTQVNVEARFKSNFSPNDNLNNRDYGFMPQMLPWQNKCIRNAVITINGSSISHRANEYGVEYCLLHGNRDYMNKIGGGINDFSKPSVINSSYKDTSSFVENPTRAMQNKRWINQMTQDKSDRSGAAQVTANTDTPTFQWEEPLYLGPFGAFQNAESFPSWSVEGQKSPGLLHVHNMQLSFALEDNWWRSMFLMIAAKNKNVGAGMAKLTGATIKNARILTKWVLPPPRMISAALTQQVSYASYDVLRFVCKDKAPGIKYDGQDSTNADQPISFELDAVSFPYQPSLYVFSVCPHYAHCSNECGNSNGASCYLDNLKMDKRMTITHIDLQINTSSNGIPYKGTGKKQEQRINARELYRMTLENAASFEQFPHNFDEWLYNCAIVAVTPAQLSGVLNSPNIRGGVTLQGTVYCRNYTGHLVNTATADRTIDLGNHVHTERGAKVPRYRCLISGFYSNRSLVLDSKSGLLQEATFSSAFQNSLRMGGMN